MNQPEGNTEATTTPSPEVVAQVAQQWLETADHDLAVVRALNNDPDAAYLSAICFHAQQCIEKIMKAVLIRKGCVFPRTHDLERLGDLLMTAGVSDVGLDRGQLARLSQYAVDTRYADNPAPSPTEADAAAVDATTVMERLRPLVSAPSASAM